MRTLLLLTLLAAPALAQTDRAEAVLAWHQDANTRCRGGSGDSQATWQACGERDAYGRVLNGMGWCYGRRGESGAAMNWHRCEANSNRPTRAQRD